MAERTKRKATQNVDYTEMHRKGSKTKVAGPKKPKTEKLPKFDQFEKEAKPLEITVHTGDGKEVFKGYAGPAAFTSRSYGWQTEHTFKTTVTVDGKTQEVEARMTVSVPVFGQVLPEAAATQAT